MLKLFKSLPTKLINATALLTLCAMPACDKKDSSTLSVSADYLYVSGRAVHVKETDKGIAGANIYIGNDSNSAATTDDEGHFGFNISQDDLSKLQKSESDTLGGQATGKFKILVDSRDPQAVGTSKTLSFSDRGSMDLGDIALGSSTKVTGLVQKLPADGTFLAAAGVKVFTANQQVTTGTDGAFTLANLPAGENTIYAVADGFAVAKTTVVSEAGKSTAIAYPLVIFPNDVLTGWVTILPRGKTEDLVAAGHPFQRSFVIAASPIAKYVRYHHERAVFDASSGDATWRDITERVNYDFPNNGGNNLYVQFADATKSKISSVLTVQSNVDIFDDTTGMVLGDGSGTVKSRNIDVHISVPRAATMMRLNTDITRLSQSEFMVAAPLTQYLAVVPNNNQNAAGITVTLYLQFSDAQNNLSPVYQASTIINLFPDKSADILKIENGATTTPNRLVGLDIRVPANAYQMRLFEPIRNGTTTDGISDEWIGSIDSTSQANPLNIWMGVQSRFFYTFATPGLKQLVLQFRDIDGLLSPAYSATIVVMPFEPGGIGFSINNGAPVTTIREVTLALVPPAGAIAFRFAEDRRPATEFDTWLTLTPYVSYSMKGRGTRTIYLEYKDAISNRSLTYSQTITVDLFGAFPGTFVINGGATSTFYPVVTLEIEPPLGATQMLITETPDRYIDGSAGDLIDCSVHSRGWMALSPVVNYTLIGQGPHGVYVKFRNNTCDESAFTRQTIDYQAFPSLNDGMVNLVALPVHFSRFIPVMLNIPARAEYMSISHLEDTTESGFGGGSGIGSSNSLTPLCPSAGGNGRAVPVGSSSVVAYELPDVDGAYRIYVRYAGNDDGGCVSSPQYFSMPVYLLRFPANTLVFTINDGATTTTDAHVYLNFDHQALDAAYVKLSETQEGLENAPNTAMTSDIPFTLTSETLGTKTIWAQYVTSTGAKSAAFAQTIKLQAPVPPTPTPIPPTPTPTPTPVPDP